MVMCVRIKLETRRYTSYWGYNNASQYNPAGPNA